jgi:1-deoxy-D-xylulose-5-phosphate reductoisomerase
MKRVVILGSTGSIGESALRVAEAMPDRIAVAGLACLRDYRGMLRQAVRFGVRDVAVGDPEQGRLCAAEAPAGMRVRAGAEGVASLAAECDAEVVLCALVGMAGLAPVMAALGAGRDVALATKEVLVAAGAIVTREAARVGAQILPVDSEHSALFQCLAGNRGPEQVKRLVLTASGGPFAANERIDLEKVTVREALKHPRWEMGRKVTIDSASLMNKGLEIMEAHWLFGVPVERIDVLIHPESIVHSMVEFVDGSVLAQLSPPDMRFAIQCALTWPERCDGGLPALDLAASGPLHFRHPDRSRFPCLDLACAAATRGGTMPAVLNAANEIAVEKFLAGDLRFPGIWALVAAVMERHRPVADPSLDEIVSADSWARREAAAWTDVEWKGRQ